jgi:hypothetical protein
LDRAFLTALLKNVGQRSFDDASLRQLDYLLYELFMNWFGIAQGSGSGTRRAEWMFSAMRDWPSGRARQRAMAWCGTAVEREILAPRAVSEAEIVHDLASSDPERVAQALVVIAGLADQKVGIELQPFGIEVLERAGAQSLDNGLAFLRVTTQFRRFVPQLRRDARMRLAIDVLVRARDALIGLYVADWLLDQGDAQQVIDQALTLLVAQGPEAVAQSEEAGASFLLRLWRGAPPRLGEPVRDVIRTRLDDAHRDRREVLSRMRGWLEGAMAERSAGS